MRPFEAGESLINLYGIMTKDSFLAKIEKSGEEVGQKIPLDLCI